MRSVTSCYNSTLYRKTMARFWPMWTVWGAFWLFLVPLNLLNSYFDWLSFENTMEKAQSHLLDIIQDIPYVLEAGGWLACVGGVLCAMAVFGYLYNNRSAGMMHGLPMTRDTLFITQYLAGLSFLLLPLLVVFLLAAAVALALLPGDMWGYAMEALGAWLLALGADCLFFFSFASFCAMFTGHILALPAFYGILNVLVLAMSSLISALMDELLFGYRGDIFDHPLVQYLTPLWMLTEASGWNRVARAVVDQETADINYIYHYTLESPGTLALYAVVGLLLAGAALLIYRRRHVESAGDVVSVPLVQPVFRWGVALCAGLCLGSVTAAFFSWTRGLPLSVCVVLWSFVGWFAAEMLLKKSFRVWKSWKGSLVMAAVLSLLCASLCLDWFGVETRVPDPDDVAVINLSGHLSYPHDSGDIDLDKVTNPRTIEMITDLHRAIVTDRTRCDRASTAYRPGEDSFSFNITYTMRDGTTLRRYYTSVPLYKDEVNAEGSVTWQAGQLIADRDLVKQCYNLDFYRDLRIVDASLSPILWSDDQTHNYEHLFLDGAAAADLPGLWQAVQTDFAEGTLGVRYLFDDDARRSGTYMSDLHLSFDRTSASAKSDGITYSSSLTITLTPNARHTLGWLEEMSGLGTSYHLAEHASVAEEEWMEKFPELAYSYEVY